MWNLIFQAVLNHQDFYWQGFSFQSPGIPDESQYVPVWIIITKEYIAIGEGQKPSVDPWLAYPYSNDFLQEASYVGFSKLTDSLGVRFNGGMCSLLSLLLISIPSAMAKEPNSENHLKNMQHL